MTYLPEPNKKANCVVIFESVSSGLNTQNADKICEIFVLQV